MGVSLSQYFPANQIYAQPFKFKTLEEVDHVRKYLDQYIIDGLDEAGFVVFGYGRGLPISFHKNPLKR